MSRSAPRWSRFLGLIPLFTIGFGTAPLFWWAALRTRRPGVWIGAVVYTLAIVAAVVISGKDSDSPLFDALLAILIFVGSGHGFMLPSALYPLSTSSSSGERDLVDVTHRTNAAAIESANALMQLRNHARALQAENPVLARELRIGRPDIHDRAFDDGGLIDINQVPAWVLAKELELSPELAARIVGERDRRSGYLAVEDIAVFCELPPGVLPLLQDRLIVTQMS